MQDTHGKFHGLPSTRIRVSSRAGSMEYAKASALGMQASQRAPGPDLIVNKHQTSRALLLRPAHEAWLFGSGRGQGLRCPRPGPGVVESGVRWVGVCPQSCRARYAGLSSCFRRLSIVCHELRTLALAGMRRRAHSGTRHTCIGSDKQSDQPSTPPRGTLKSRRAQALQRPDAEMPGHLLLCCWSQRVTPRATKVPRARAAGPKSAISKSWAEKRACRAGWSGSALSETPRAPLPLRAPFRARTLEALFRHWHDIT